MHPNAARPSSTTLCSGFGLAMKPTPHASLSSSSQNSSSLLAPAGRAEAMVTPRTAPTAAVAERGEEGEVVLREMLPTWCWCFPATAVAVRAKRGFTKPLVCIVSRSSSGTAWPTAAAQPAALTMLLRRRSHVEGRPREDVSGWTSFVAVCVSRRLGLHGDGRFMIPVGEAGCFWHGTPDLRKRGKSADRPSIDITAAQQREPVPTATTVGRGNRRKKSGGLVASIPRDRALLTPRRARRKGPTSGELCAGGWDVVAACAATAVQILGCCPGEWR